MKLQSYIFLLLVMLTVTGCRHTKNMQVQLPVFDKQGHRGARGLMPENTIPAMLKAIDLGVTTLEMDAVVTKDKQVILSHEPFFNHDITTKPDGNAIDKDEEKTYNIYAMTYMETQHYDVGLKPHPRFPQQQRLPAHKPLLKNVIDSVISYCKKNNRPVPFFNIETKTQAATDNTFHPAPQEFVELLIQIIEEKQLLAKVIIQSFDFRTLIILHDKYPAVMTATLIEDYDKRTVKDHIKELGFTPTIYSPAFSLVNLDLVNYCHQHNMKVIPWTVNEKSGIDALRAMGVDGIITDYPDLFQNL